MRCDYGGIFRFDGEAFRYTRVTIFSGTSRGDGGTHCVLVGSAIRRIGSEPKPVHIPDVLNDPEYELSEPYQKEGVRSVLAVPLLKETTLIGALVIHRREVRPFTEAQIKLLETFADQALIAIENVRLFQELQQRNRDLTEALEQQTATSEVLRVIASSPTDLQPVLDALIANAVRLRWRQTRSHPPT